MSESDPSCKNCGCPYPQGNCWDGVTATQWQAIETAPFDEDVLVFAPDSIDTIFIAHRFNASDWNGDWYDQNAEANPSPVDVEIIYWMPLPEPPLEPDGGID